MVMHDNVLLMVSVVSKHLLDLCRWSTEPHRSSYLCHIAIASGLRHVLLLEMFEEAVRVVEK